MSVEIKYMLKIQMQEIFKNIKIYVSMYALIILLSGVLYAQGFSMKITSNLVILMWISLMTFLGVKVFIEGERGSLFIITQRPLFLKYARLISVQILFNLPLFACIYMQLFFIRQDFLKSLGLSLLSYLFAVMLGLFLGNTASKKSGFVILLLVFIYNFLCLIRIDRQSIPISLA